MSTSPPATQANQEEELKSIKLTINLRDSSRQLYHLISGTEYKGTVKVIKKMYDDLEKLRDAVDRLLKKPDRHRWQGIPSKTGWRCGMFILGLIIGVIIVSFLMSYSSYSTFGTKSSLTHTASDRPVRQDTSHAYPSESSCNCQQGDYMDRP